MKKIEVVAAIITYNNKILCVQRSAGKFDYISFKYEFPGGKVEANETNVEALKREIKEELHMNIDVRDEFLTIHHQYPDFFITMNSFFCTCSSPNLKLEVHVDYKWLMIDKLSSLDWAAADIPIVKKLMG
ncbi:MAG: (deoxy)nucleoside triphosphate pyrophosphohydrolase [Chloroflexi bacterium]|nr:(deoxy)nucleoside triphosphate pyrophosphohydrolase [Chloroflexota bacterium]